MKEVYNVNQRGGATHVPRPTRPTISNKKETIIISAKEFQKLQEQLNTAKKHVEHVIGTIKHDGHSGTIQTDWILPDLEKVLEEIGGGEDGK